MFPLNVYGPVDRLLDMSFSRASRFPRSNKNEILASPADFNLAEKASQPCSCELRKLKESHRTVCASIENSRLPAKVSWKPKESIALCDSGCRLPRTIHLGSVHHPKTDTVNINELWSKRSKCKKDMVYPTQYLSRNNVNVHRKVLASIENVPYGEHRGRHTDLVPQKAPRQSKQSTSSSRSRSRLPQPIKPKPAGQSERDAVDITRASSKRQNCTRQASFEVDAFHRKKANVTAF